MSIQRSRIWLGIGLLAVVAYSVWWWLAAQALQARIDGWVAQQRAAGATVAPERFAVGGYPFAFAVAADGVVLKWPTGFGLASQHLRIAAHPWSPLSFKVAATGGFSFDLPQGTERPAYLLAGETLRGHARFGDVPFPLDLDLTADGVSAKPTPPSTPTSKDNEGQDGREITIATLEFSGSRPSTPALKDTEIGLDLAIHLIDLSAAALEKHPLGATIADAMIKAQLMGPLPASADAAGLKAWRDAGGTVEISDLGLRWGPLALTGKGTAAFDAAMQPEGAFSAHLTGYDKTIDALAQAAWIKPGPASLAKLALGVASRPGPDGQPAVDTPVTIQSRRISVGPLKVGEIPELKLD